MQKQRTISLIASTLLLGVALTGCGGSSNSNDTTNTGTITPQNTISGKAADGYLRYSTVCLDLNNDGYCQPSEPYGITDVNGSFSLTLTSSQKADANIQTAQLLIYGGQDSDTAEDFIGKLKAPNDGSGTINVTPITTLVAASVDSNGTGTQKAKIDAAKAKVAKVLGLTKEQVDADPIALAKSGQSKVLSKALQVQKAVEKIVTTVKAGQNVDAHAAASSKVFQALAKSLSTDANVTVASIVGNAQEKIQTALDINETAIGSTISNAQNLATVVNSTFDDASGELNTTQIATISSSIATMKNETTITSDMNATLFEDQAKIDAVNRILEGLGSSDYSPIPPSELVDLINPTMTLNQMREALDLNGNYTDLVSKIDAKLAKIAEDKAQVEQIQTDATDAAKPFVALTLPLSIYDFYNDNDKYTFETHTLTSDKKFVDTKTKYNPETQTFDSATHSNDYELSSAGWVHQNDNATATPQSDNSVLVYNGKFGITEITDIAGAYTVKNDNGNDEFNITMPSGAKTYMTKFEVTQERYTLYEPQRNWNDVQNGNVSYYTTLGSVITGQCGTSWTMGDHNGGYAFAGTETTDANGYASYSCDATATSGKLFEVEQSDNGGKVVNKDAGTWEIKTVLGKQMLIATPYDTMKYGGNSHGIFVVANPDGAGDRVWQGAYDKIGDIHTWTSYNKTTMDAIKAKIQSSN